MNEQEIKQALARLDSVVAAMNLPRMQHLQLVQDVRAVQRRVELSFALQAKPPVVDTEEEPEVTLEATDVGTDQ
jgi:hypothetical protein